MSNLVKKIQNSAFQHHLWQKGSKIVLGVSGGPDSVCLLDVMAKLAPKYDLKLIITHVNYRLRGRDSERDEKFVRKLAEKYGLNAFFLKPKLGKKISENEMRDIRYEFFEKVRAKNNFDTVAVAHNLDDQVETFLMRLIRGSGLKGLSAMQHKSVHPVKSALRSPALAGEFNRGTIIRPLLGTTRAEILGYLKKNKSTYRTDRTNEMSLFFRNKIRNKLIPFLEKDFNPKIKETIFNAISSIAEDHSLIQKLADKTYKNEKEISAKKILQMHPALQRRFLLRMISEKNPGGKDVEAAHVSEMIKALKSTKNKSQIVSFKGLKMERKGDKVTIAKL
ncbi:MAG: tRNA lysidine(34) synthetase TilS [Candidatus Moranbacteria bacterium RBG_19FT_COMBO_42_6]|nr:MAG: tRNA lysidine(34) synthetase TilS [Candidatus Moranbacteria bacterium RBG_19FT_COMBO_42_6]